MVELVVILAQAHCCTGKLNDVIPAKAGIQQTKFAARSATAGFNKLAKYIRGTSFPRKRESRHDKILWIPAYAGMTCGYGAGRDPGT